MTVSGTAMRCLDMPKSLQNHFPNCYRGYLKIEESIGIGSNLSLNRMVMLMLAM
jgi:hypothetical protein